MNEPGNVSRSEICINHASFHFIHKTIRLTTMATKILEQIDKALETGTWKFLAFSGLGPTVSAEILNKLSQKNLRGLGLR